MKTNDNSIQRYLHETIDTLNSLKQDDLTNLKDLLLETYDKGNTIYVFGNGGSGATASHFCGDLLKGVSLGLKKRFKVICLNDNMPGLLAIANDISYEEIFVEQLKNFLVDGDLVIGISGSGNSPNIVKAIKYANSKTAATVAICGFDGGEIKKLAQHSVHAKTNNMEIAEDVHSYVFHCVKTLLMEYFKEANI